MFSIRLHYQNDRKGLGPREGQRETQLDTVNCTPLFTLIIAFLWGLSLAVPLMAICNDSESLQ